MNIFELFFEVLDSVFQTPHFILVCLTHLQYQNFIALVNLVKLRLLLLTQPADLTVQQAAQTNTEVNLLPL